MYYYGFDKKTKECHFSSDGPVPDTEDVIVVTSAVSYSNLHRLTFEEVDGEFVIHEKEPTHEELLAKFEQERSHLLAGAGEQQRILQDVIDYGDSEVAPELLEVWRKYRATVWGLTYEKYTTDGWPTQPE